MAYLDSYDEQLLEIEAREKALRATIKSKLDELKLERLETLKRREQARDKYILSHEPKDLLNPEKATELYLLGFDDQRGGAAFIKLYTRLLEGTYLYPLGGWWTLSTSSGPGGEQAPVKAPTWFIENEKDPEKIQRTVELLEPLYLAALAVNPTVKVELYGNGWRYSLTYRDETWNLIGYSDEEARGQRIHESSSNLKELLETFVLGI